VRPQKGPLVVVRRAGRARSSGGASACRRKRLISKTSGEQLSAARPAWPHPLGLLSIIWPVSHFDRVAAIVFRSGSAADQAASPLISPSCELHFGAPSATNLIVNPIRHQSGRHTHSSGPQFRPAHARHDGREPSRRESSRRHCLFAANSNDTRWPRQTKAGAGLLLSSQICHIGGRRISAPTNLRESRSRRLARETRIQVGRRRPRLRACCLRADLLVGGALERSIKQTSGRADRPTDGART
jgi:hypothetical protein